MVKKMSARGRLARLGLLVLMVTACGEKEVSSLDDHLASARDLIAAGDGPSAQVELKAALRLDPRNARARFMLGKLYLEYDENESAEKELLRARELGAAASDVSPALAQTLIAQLRLEDLIALETAPLEAPAAARVLTLQAVGHSLRGEVEQAESAILQANELDPSASHVQIALARMQSLRGDNTGALQALDDILQRYPASAEAWRLKAHLLWRNQELEQAREAFDSAIGASRINFADRVNHSLIDLQLGDYGAAKAQLGKLLKLGRNHAGTQYIKGLLHFHDEAYQKSIKALSPAIAVAPKYPKVLFYLAVSNVINGELQYAAEFTEDFLELQPDSLQGHKLMAAILARQNKVELAREATQQLLDYNPNDIGAIATLIDIELQEQHYALALRLLHLLDSLAAGNDYAFESAAVPLTQGVLTDTFATSSKEALANAIGHSASPGRELVMTVFAHLKNKEPQQALKLVQEFQLSNIEQIGPYALLARVQIEAGLPEQARDTLRNAISRDPNSVEPNLALAQLAHIAQDYTEERGRYAAILALDPGHLPARMRLAALESRGGNTQAMAAQLQRARELNPTALEPRLALARYFINAGKPEAVQDLFAPLSSLQQRSPRLLNLFVEAQLALGNMEQAEAALEILASSFPESADVHYLMFRTLHQTDPKRAEEALAAALAADSSHAPALVSAAINALSAGDHGAAQQYIGNLQETAPDNADLPRLQSELAVAKGNFEEAVAVAQSAFKSRPDSNTLFVYVDALKNVGQSKRAQNVLEEWLDAHSEDVAARLTLTSLLEESGDLKAAQAQYAQVVQEDPGNVLALNNLAWMLRTTEPATARDLIARAVALAPKNYSVLDTKAMIEHANGNHEAALQGVESALSFAPDHPSLTYHLAMVLAAQGKKARAKSVLQKLLSKPAVFAEEAQARELLAQLDSG